MQRSNFRPGMLVCAALLAVAPAARGLADQQLETVTVLVARKDVAMGELIKEPASLFKYVRYVKGDEPKGAVTDLAKLKDRRLVRSLAEDQPVKERDLLQDGQFVYRIPKGVRAVSVKVENAADSGEFPPTGSRVDVISAVTRDGKTEAKTILQNLLLIAMDPGPIGTPRPWVTLAVTPEQAETLTSASQAGGLRLVLRQPAKD